MTQPLFLSLRTFLSSVASWALLVLFVAASRGIHGQTSIKLGTDSTKFVLNGTIINPDRMLKRKAVIEGDVLTWSRLEIPMVN